jgi:hypothetical protein
MVSRANDVARGSEYRWLEHQLSTHVANADAARRRVYSVSSQDLSRCSCPLQDPVDYLQLSMNSMTVFKHGVYDRI